MISWTENLVIGAKVVCFFLAIFLIAPWFSVVMENPMELWLEYTRWVKGVLK